MGEMLDGYLENNPKFTAAIVCYLVRGDEVLLIVRKQTSTGLGRGKVAGVGGKLEKGESAEQALHREVSEEIGSNGLRLLSWEHRGRARFGWTGKTNWNMDVEIFVVTKWKGEPAETDDAKPEWFGIDELPLDRMWADNAHWVPRVLKGEKLEWTFLLDDNDDVVDYEMKALQP